MKNLVSIIIATFNQSDKISETLESVIAQTHQNWECIVVDDKSTDQTAETVIEITKKHPRIKYYLSPKEVKKGPNGARNYGIEKSTGMYVMSLDSDDLLEKKHLEKKVNLFKENPDIDGVLSKTVLINNQKEIIGYEERTIISNNLLEDFITLKISWYMHDIMWKRSFFEGKTLYNINLLKMLDRDFHVRMLSYMPKLLLLDDFLALYRIYNTSNSSNMSPVVAETRHRAVIDAVKILKSKELITNKILFFYLKFQIKNVVVLYKSNNCIKLYIELFRNVFKFNAKNVFWFFRLILAYTSYKITNRGLIFIKEKQ